MKKVKLFCSILLAFIFSLFSFSSGNKQTKQIDYIIKKDQEAASLVINLDNFKKEYQTNEEIDFSTIKASFDNKELKYVEKLTDNYVDSFFIATSDNDPLNSILQNKSTVSGNNKQNSINIYVGHKEIEHDSTIVYLATINLSINNPSAVDKWVIYLIMGLVFVAFGAFACLKSYNDKKKKNMMQISTSSQSQHNKNDNQVKPTDDNKYKEECSSDDEVK